MRLNKDCTHSHSADLLRGQSVYRLRYFCKLFIKLIRRKIIIIVAIRCHVLKLKCTSAPPDPLAGFNCPTSKGKEERMENKKGLERAK